MKNLNFSRLSVYIDKTVHPIYEQLSSRSSKDVLNFPFETMKDLFIASACVGKKYNRYEELKSTREIFDATLFNSKTEVPVLLSLAFARNQDIEDLSDERTVLNIAQAWANGGIQIIKEQLLENPGTPLFNLVKFLLSENKINQEGLESFTNKVTNERDAELTCDKSIGNFNGSDLRELLYIFECEIKRFIARNLEKITSEWWKRNVPEEIRTRAEKRKESRENPIPGMDRQNRPVIDYIDFPDIKTLITLKQNWESVFKSFFKRQDLIQVKLDEIAPMRNDLAHNRDLSTNDREIFVTSIRQLLRIIRASEN